MNKKVYVTCMDVETCEMHETKEFEAEFNDEETRFTLLGNEHLAVEIDMPILWNEKVFVITTDSDADFIKFILMRRCLQKYVEEKFEKIGGLYGA